MTAAILIIGTGLAGYQLAREFRKVNTTTPLLIITADDGRFYPKPQLSNALTQKKLPAAIATATAEAMAKQLNATLLTNTTVTSIDPIQKTVTTSTQTFSYEKCVLACGADVIKPPLSGDAISDVLSINHIYHYETFAELIRNKKYIAVLGAGLIGCEFANDLSNAGYEVHVIAPDQTPLSLFVPDIIGKKLQSALTQNGVHFHLECVANTITKLSDGYELALSNGEKIKTEFVLSAIGLKPHIALAKTANLVVSRGVLVNRLLATSDPHIFALGDCAEVEGHVLPFITPILNCAKALAKTLNGEATPVDYPAMPITVKTPAHPIVVCPPPKNMAGEWQIEENNSDVKALFYNAQQQLYGFVLTHGAVKFRMELAGKIPSLF